MTDLSKLPARVNRKVAMELLCLHNNRAFKRVVDANPGLMHKLPGESRAKYRTEVIARLLLNAVCDPRGDRKVDS